VQECARLRCHVADDDRAHRHAVDARPQIGGADALGERRLLLGVQRDDDLVGVELDERVRIASITSASPLCASVTCGSSPASLDASSSASEAARSSFASQSRNPCRTTGTTTLTSSTSFPRRARSAPSACSAAPTTRTLRPMRMIVPVRAVG